MDPELTKNEIFSKEAIDYLGKMLDLYIGGRRNAYRTVYYTAVFAEILVWIKALFLKTNYAKNLNSNQGMITGTSAFVYRN